MLPPRCKEREPFAHLSKTRRGRPASSRDRGRNCQFPTSRNQEHYPPTPAARARLLRPHQFLLVLGGRTENAQLREPHHKEQCNVQRVLRCQHLRWPGLHTSRRSPHRVVASNDEGALRRRRAPDRQVQGADPPLGDARELPLASPAQGDRAAKAGRQGTPSLPVRQ